MTTSAAAPAPVCSECGRPGQCAGCYLMEISGVPSPSRVHAPTPPTPTAHDERNTDG